MKHAFILALLKRGTRWLAGFWPLALPWACLALVALMVPNVRAQLRCVVRGSSIANFDWCYPGNVFRPGWKGDGTPLQHAEQMLFDGADRPQWGNLPALDRDLTVLHLLPTNETSALKYCQTLVARNPGNRDVALAAAQVVVSQRFAYYWMDWRNTTSWGAVEPWIKEVIRQDPDNAYPLLLLLQGEYATYLWNIVGQQSGWGTLPLGKFTAEQRRSSRRRCVQLLQRASRCRYYDDGAMARTATALKVYRSIRPRTTGEELALLHYGKRRSLSRPITIAMGQMVVDEIASNGGVQGNPERSLELSRDMARLSQLILHGRGIDRPDAAAGFLSAAHRPFLKGKTTQGAAPSSQSVKDIRMLGAKVRRPEWASEILAAGTKLPGTPGSTAFQMYGPMSGPSSQLPAGLQAAAEFLANAVAVVLWEAMAMAAIWIVAGALMWKIEAPPSNRMDRVLPACLACACSAMCGLGAAVLFERLTNSFDSFLLSVGMNLAFLAAIAPIYVPWFLCAAMMRRRCRELFGSPAPRVRVMGRASTLILLAENLPRIIMWSAILAIPLVTLRWGILWHQKETSWWPAMYALYPREEWLTAETGGGIALVYNHCVLLAGVILGLITWRFFGYSELRPQRQATVRWWRETLGIAVVALCWMAAGCIVAGAVPQTALHGDIDRLLAAPARQNTLARQ